MFGYPLNTSPSSNHTVPIRETTQILVAPRGLGSSRNPFHGKASSGPRKTVSRAVLGFSPF